MLRSSTTESFLAKFKTIDVADLYLKNYPQTYCKHLLAHLDYYVTIYQQIIDLAAKSAKKPISSLTVLDFGSGNGFLGMFAKHYGFKRVWLCDIALDFLEASEKTALKVNIEIDGFIHGDIDAVQVYFKKQDIKPDILLATDVIEHVYDLEHLFQSLKLLNPELISVFTTASNPFNFRKVKELHKMQHKDEWVGYGNLSKGDLEEKGLAALSFFEQRKKIISNAFVELPENIVSELAYRTRGKAAKDILSCVDSYLNTGLLPEPPSDIYWVCDPYTGSWTERILPLKTYRELLLQSGFKLVWYNGFYNPYAKSFLSSFIVRGLNMFIKLQKHFGKYFAPYIILLAAEVESDACKTSGNFKNRV